MTDQPAPQSEKRGYGVETTPPSNSPEIPSPPRSQAKQRPTPHDLDAAGNCRYCHYNSEVEYGQWAPGEELPPIGCEATIEGDGMSAYHEITLEDAFSILVNDADYDELSDYFFRMLVAVKDRAKSIVTEEVRERAHDSDLHSVTINWEWDNVALTDDGDPLYSLTPVVSVEPGDEVAESEIAEIITDMPGPWPLSKAMSLYAKSGVANTGWQEPLTSEEILQKEKIHLDLRPQSLVLPSGPHISIGTKVIWTANAHTEISGRVTKIIDNNTVRVLLEGGTEVTADASELRPAMSVEWKSMSVTRLDDAEQ